MILDRRLRSAVTRSKIINWPEQAAMQYRGLACPGPGISETRRAGRPVMRDRAVR